MAVTQPIDCPKSEPSELPFAYRRQLFEAGLKHRKKQGRPNVVPQIRLPVQSEPSEGVLEHARRGRPNAVPQICMLGQCPSYCMDHDDHCLTVRDSGGDLIDLLAAATTHPWTSMDDDTHTVDMRDGDAAQRAKDAEIKQARECEALFEEAFGEVLARRSPRVSNLRSRRNRNFWETSPAPAVICQADKVNKIDSELKRSRNDSEQSALTCSTLSLQSIRDDSDADTTSDSDTEWDSEMEPSSTCSDAQATLDVEPHAQVNSAVCLTPEVTESAANGLGRDVPALELSSLTGKPLGSMPWSLGQSAFLCKGDPDPKLMAGVPLLDRSRFSSVSSTVEFLNKPEGRGACPGGICVVFSTSQDAYFILYREDRKAEAFTFFSLQSARKNDSEESAGGSTYSDGLPYDKPQGTAVCGERLSAFHLIPLFPPGEDGTPMTHLVNFICEIPKARNSGFNYGRLPLILEDTDAGHLGTGCPKLAVCEIGSRTIATDEVRRAKVLGIICVYFAQEANKTVVVIDEQDRWADELDDINDVERLLPGILDQIPEQSIDTPVDVKTVPRDDAVDSILEWQVAGTLGWLQSQG